MHQFLRSERLISKVLNLSQISSLAEVGSREVVIATKNFLYVRVNPYLVPTPPKSTASSTLLRSPM